MVKVGKKRQHSIEENEEGSTAKKKTPARKAPLGRNFRGDGKDKWDNVFSHRPVIVKRDVLIDEFKHADFRHEFKRRGWSKILSIAKDVFEDAVREFYSNFHIKEDSEFTASVFIRGKTIEFSAKSIASFIGISREPNPQFTFKFDQVVLPDNNEIAAHLCGQRRAWPPKGMKQSFLTDDNRMLNLIVCACINPTSHTNNVRLAVGRFIYAFNKGMLIDLPSYIFEVVAAAAKSTNKKEGLPFSSLITGIARAENVALNLKDVIQYKDGPIGISTFNKSLAQTKPARTRESGQTPIDDTATHIMSLPPTPPRLALGEPNMDTVYAVLRDVVHGMRVSTFRVYKTLYCFDKKLTQMEMEMKIMRTDMKQILQTVLEDCEDHDGQI